MVYLAHFPVGGGEDGGFLRLSRVVQRRAHFLAQLAVVAVLALCATELLASASGLRSALFQDSEKDSQGTGSPPSTSSLQNSQSTPQNPPPPPQTSPVIPEQQTQPSPQVPSPSAQLPEPPIQNPDVQPAPKPALAPPALTIPRLPRPPALEDFLSIATHGGIDPRKAKGA